MEDDLSAWLNLHNSFGFPHDTTPQDLTPPNETCHGSDIMTTGHGEAVPEFLSDHGTPTSPWSSLVTPTDPLYGMFRYPPSHTPFPSEDWNPSHPNSSFTSFAYPNPPLHLHAIPPSHTFPSEDWNPSHPLSTSLACPNPPLHLHASPYPHQPTWRPHLQENAGFANHSPLPVVIPHTAAEYEVAIPTFPSPTFHGMFDPLDGSNNPAMSSCEGNKPTSNGRDRATTGPKRIERSRKRRAPYPVNKGHEGAQNFKLVSQQASLSETPGYGDVNAPKCTTKSRSNKKAHGSPKQPVAGPSTSVDQSVAADSGIHIPQRATYTRPITTRMEIPTDTPPEAKGIRAIRSHARSKKSGPSKVQCAFVNVNCEDFREQA